MELLFLKLILDFFKNRYKQTRIYKCLSVYLDLRELNECSTLVILKFTVFLLSLCLAKKKRGLRIMQETG